MRYILHISSYEGLVPGACHYRGRVEGEHPRPCHGNSTTYHGQAGPLQGKTTCAEGHVLPEQVRWDVEAEWSEARLDRWAAAHFEGEGPSQFDTERAVVDRAMIQFLDGMEKVNDPAEEGDELWYGFVGEGELGESLQDPEDGWGMRIAVCRRG